MLLTDEERERFATYLEQDAESSRLIIEQMKNLPVAQVMVKAATAEMHAALIVARKLRSLHSQTIDR